VKPCHEPATGWKTDKGYVKLRMGGKVYKAHRLAFFRTHGWWPVEVGHRCNHPWCDEPTHLYATDTIENNQYKVDCGRQAKGEGHGRAKLTDDQVTEIRTRWTAGAVQAHLAREFGVSPTQVHNLVHGKQRSTV
jgi:hypothetical protein